MPVWIIRFLESFSGISGASTWPDVNVRNAPQRRTSSLPLRRKMIAVAGNLESVDSILRRDPALIDGLVVSLGFPVIDASLARAGSSAFWPVPGQGG